MVTAREAFEAKKLAQKYGVIGKVAGLYRMAGYEVEVKDTSDGAEFNFIARKRRESLIVKVYTKNNHVPLDVVEKLAKAGSEGGYKPILVLYGRGPKVTTELINKAKELNVSLRRVRL